MAFDKPIANRCFIALLMKTRKQKIYIKNDEFEQGLDAKRRWRDIKKPCTKQLYILKQKNKSRFSSVHIPIQK
jgi:hypothetical protein